MPNSLNDYITSAARAELLRRARVQEELLRQAILAGAASLTLEWPDDFSTGTTRWMFPVTRRRRRAALRLAHDA